MTYFVSIRLSTFVDMKIRLTCLGIILFAFKLWILADSNITGVLYNQYGKPISDAEIFINDKDKLITILKFKKGKLIYSKRNQNKEWHKIIVNMNEKEEIILDFT